MNTRRGYKVFNPDWTCRDFQYEVGKIYEETAELEICKNGFHFCKQITDCFNYYQFSPDIKVAEVVALGKVIEKGDKGCTNKIRILREITWKEVLKMCNIGKFCTGCGNTGNKNGGSWNTGNRNTGLFNSGDDNAGNYNTGCFNSGYNNTGNRNIGSFNSGYSNKGCFNSGDNNDGSYNVGNFNAGDFNVGNFNNGDFNVGDYNNASHTIGCFNTKNQKLKFFDKETDMTLEQWQVSEAKHLLDYVVMLSDSPTDANERWNKLRENEKSIIMNIPNFDAKKFELITGIKVE